MITNPLLSAEDALKQLKRIWSTDELKFVAKYQKGLERKNGFFIELKANDREIFYPKSNSEELIYSRKIKVFVPKSVDLEHNKHYLIEVDLEDDYHRLKNPYKLKLTGLYELGNYKTPKQFINERFFEKGNSPSDAATIASQLSLNELELYTHTKRFIFELIQNADDMPREGKSVNIEVFLTRNFLLFLHDGKFFDRGDVEAICDAARSNKKQNTTQTGYKGIGFKSVFTDSSKVYIKSGSYSFKFDKEAEVYKDFWKLYSGRVLELNSEARLAFKERYSEKESEFLKIENIPWQIKPIWVERAEYPEELINSPFIDPKYQVAIALEVGESKINDKDKDYHKMINQLINEPRFLLFLRNVTGLNYQKINDVSSSEVKINIWKKRSSIDVKKNDQLLASYLKRDFSVTLNNEDFQKAGLEFTKVEKSDKTVFVDSEGKQLDNIPEKLVNLQKTTLSFAARIEGNEIQSLTSENSILFNYLPTSDSRFGFHFLVNADFVSKTDREFIQIENKWNHYLFYKIGFNLVKWLAKIIEENKYQTKESEKTRFKFASSYLSLLPERLLDEDNQERGIINKAFNTGLKDGIKNTDFILSSVGSLKKASEIVTDSTGLLRILKGKGIRFLKLATKTTKEFNSILINEFQLSQKYLEIEQIEREQLIELLAIGKNRELFRAIVQKLKEKEYGYLLTWLDSFLINPDAVAKIGYSLPFIKIGEQVLSVNECHENQSIFIKTRKIEKIESTLIRNKFNLTEFFIDDYSHLFNLAKKEDTYLTNDLKLYRVFADSSNLAALNPEEKLQLVDFLISLEQVGPGRVYSELRLFKAKKSRELFPLSHLISGQEKSIPNWFEGLTISENEEKALSANHYKNLQKESSLLKILCQSELFGIVSKEVLSQGCFNEFYDFLERLFKGLDESEKIDFSNIPWIYSPNKEKFLLPSEIYCPDSFEKIENIKDYYNVKSKLEAITDLNLPIFKSLSIIRLFSLGCISGSIISFINKEEDFDLVSIKSFFDWLDLNNEGDFLKKINFQEKENHYRLTNKETKAYYFTKSQELINYIKTKELMQGFLLLPDELYSKSCKTLGLLMGENLGKTLIKNGANEISFSAFLNATKYDALKFKFVESVEKIELSTNMVYDKNTDEHHFLKLVEDLVRSSEEQAADLLIETVRNKIILDSISLNEKAISEDIYFPDKGEIKGFTIGTKLSDVLEKYKNNSFSVNLLVNSLPGIQANLVRKIFKVARKKPDWIFKELNQMKLLYYDAYQTYFLARYRSHFDKGNVFQSTPSFSFFKQLNNEQNYLKEAIKFLDLSFSDNFQSSNVFEILGINISDCIYDDEYSITSERLPDWIIKWYDGNDSKIDFIHKCGLNGSESPVVLLRSGLVRNNPDLVGRGRETLQGIILLKNTLLWLLDKQEKTSVILKKEFLSPLYQKLKRENVPISNIPIPVLKSIGEDNYTLKMIVDTNKVHVYNSSWGNYAKEIIFELKKLQNDIIDDTIGSAYLADIKAQSVTLYDGYDKEYLNENSILFEVSWYKEWRKGVNYPIHLYKGKRLPHIISYASYFNKRSEAGAAAMVDGHIYVVKSREASILDEIEEFISPTDFRELLNLKRKFDKEQKELERKVSYSEEEEEALKRVFGDNAPKGFRKDLNLASLIKGLSFLHHHGYDVSHAEENLIDSHNYSNLYPVYKDGMAYTVKCRSAKSGLLYLRASTWKELQNPNTFLYVWTGTSFLDAKLCKSREEVVQDLKADYQVVRLESKASATTLDNFLNGKLDPEDIWLIIRTKFKEEYRGIFEDIRKKSKTDSLEALSAGNEDED